MIVFDKVLPIPIAELNYSNSSVWNKENVSFKREDFTLIRSTSGKGKTTLLSIIYGIRNDYSGRVFFNEKDISTFSTNKKSLKRQNKLAYLFQGLRLFSDLTGLENIEINNQLTKYKTKKQIYEMADLLGVKENLDKQVLKLSFGQRQRIALIRSLCQPYEYLLLDEPFSHLDRQNQNIACKLIESECKEQGAGLILASLDSGYSIEYNKTYEI